MAHSMIPIPRFILGGLAVVLVVAGWVWFNGADRDHEVLAPVPVETTTLSETAPPAESSAPSIVPPLDQSAKRVTKKPFSLLIDRATSPVQPERFSGYHTGVDFETFSSEEMTDVAVQAICSGDILTKRQASGYGGVLVTSCLIDGEEVTIVYGHLRLSSITVRVGERVVVGDQLGLLGTGGSSETDGERKHLHLAIHRGPTPNILGYVSSRADLSNWLDPCLYVCQ